MTTVLATLEAQSTVVEWQTNSQNFVIKEVTGEPQLVEQRLGAEHPRVARR